MKLTTQQLVSWIMVMVMAFGLSFDADAQRKKKKKKKKKKGKTEQVEKKVLPSRIINSDRSEVCEVFTGSAEPTDADLARISQNFADMNLRRQVGDYGPGFHTEDGEFSALYYWEKMYQEAPGFSILVYTDGSTIYREMAAKAKENGDEETFKSNIQKAYELIEEGEKCYPDTKGKFGPTKAYLKELEDPSAYQEILDLYTEGFNDDTDPYSLGSITRYAQYMGYIDQIPRTKADEWLNKCRAVAQKHPNNKDYEYALEEIDAFQEMYTEAWDKRLAQETAANKQVTPGTSTGSTGGQTSGNNGLYEEMMAAFKGGDLNTANNKFNEYIGTVEDPKRKYDVSMYAAQTLYSKSNYPLARSAFRKAMAADPSQGDPYYFIGLMYLSSGELCGPGTGFDSQRVIWPAFDQFNLAKSKVNINPEYAADIAKTVNTYKQYLPTNAQLAEQGISVGSSYTVPCWINETTVARSNTSISN